MAPPGHASQEPRPPAQAEHAGPDARGQIRGGAAINVFDKRLSRAVHRQAITVVLLAIALLVGSTMALMFIGRLGPVTLASALALRNRAPLYEYPKESPLIG